MNRRNFLRLAALSGAGLSVLRADVSEAAEPHAGPYVCVINASGGWDTTAIMDPKGTAELNRLYSSSDIQTSGQISFAPTEGLVAAGALTNEVFFDRYASELLVVNGIDISVNNHSPCSKYMGTGKLDSDRYPAFAALAAASLAPEAPLSFMALDAFSTTGSLIAKNTINDFPSLLTLARADYVAYDSSERYLHQQDVNLIDQALNEAGQQTLPGSVLARDFLRKAQTVSKDLGRIEDWIPQSLPSDNMLRKVEVALTGFASGTCAAATLGLSQFDSHANNDADQMDLIPRLLAAVDHLMVRAEELGIRDKLLVVVQSEMGRTPWYNENDGKDHWSVGSMMFLGHGVAGNRVVGGTDGELAPYTVDPQTLNTSDSGIRIRPEHIHDALRSHLGIAKHPFATQFDLGVNPDERLTKLFTG